MSATPASSAIGDTSAMIPAPLSSNRSENAPICAVDTGFMRADHAIVKNTQVASTGLKKYEPIPPKPWITSAIAKNEPITGIHNGTSGGMISANNNPTKTAFPLPIVRGCLNIVWMAASVITADAIPATIIIRACSPKK